VASYTAFFDLDHTIISTSSGRVMFRGSIEHGLLRKRHARLAVVYAVLYRLGMTDADAAVKRWLSWYAGTPANRIDLFADEWADELKHSIREDARREIERHRKEGGRTVILSASPSFICERIRDHLGMDDILCTELEIQGGVLTGRMRGAYCYGPEKLSRARAYCEAHGLSLHDAWYYADSQSDFYVLEAVGNPVCVTPDAKLARMAKQRGWRIALWR